VGDNNGICLICNSNNHYTKILHRKLIKRNNMVDDPGKEFPVADVPGECLIKYKLE